ncbi:MAG: hypothetical protein AMS23_06055 [Bacteroides sp. SM1_62]|nr:MAG: hypothetical protein AMS23_06055 [Bacteroides sp. SM1_62]
MKSRQISVVSLILAILTGIWILCMILLLQQQGDVIATFEDAYDFVKDPGGLFYLTYLNVVVLTIFDVVLFGMLYLYFKPAYPVLSLCGILFVPVYAAYNMFVYISQVSVVQKIISVYDGLIREEVMQVLLGQFIQLWEHSTMAFINNYAYAILGIPSILFGMAIYRMKPASNSSEGADIPVLSRATGLLLMLNALACFLGIIGIITEHQILAYGSSIGGGLFFFSLIGMSIVFWRD